MPKLLVHLEFPILIGKVDNKEVECDLRPLMRLVPRLKRSDKHACIEQLVRLNLEPMQAMLFVLIAREWTEDRRIEGQIIEIQGGPGSELVSSFEEGEVFDGNHIFFVRARIPDEDKQKKYRRILGANTKRKTTEEEREIRPMKEFAVKNMRDFNLNNLLDAGDRGRGGSRDGRDRRRNAKTNSRRSSSR